MKHPDFSDVIAAHELIKGQINHTPVLSSGTLNKLTGAELFFKCENFQKVGAFKFRGASNAVLSLSDEEASKGVATHSSGNHAQALALAGRMRGIKATIIMPENAPAVKKNAVKEYGADIIFCKPTLEARETSLNNFIEKSGATFIHPYNNFNVIAGQGTAAKELIEEIPELDVIIAPVGGGGLLSGTCISTSAMSPNAEIYAAEPEGADDAYKSLLKGEIIPSVDPDTICDGLLTSLGEMTFPIINNHVKRIITVTDALIIKAMRLVWERMKIIIEPSSATVLAAILKEPELFEHKRTGLIISGGNVELNKLPF